MNTCENCSGCDALRAAETWGDVQELFNELVDEVKWLDSSQETITYLETDRSGLDYGWHSEEHQKFIRLAIEELTKPGGPKSYITE